MTQGFWIELLDLADYNDTGTRYAFWQITQPGPPEPAEEQFARYCEVNGVHKDEHAALDHALRLLQPVKAAALVCVDHAGVADRLTFRVVKPEAFVPEGAVRT
jgi:hypothetical protein